MLRALLVAAVLTIPTVASAGVYVSAGLGTTGVSDSSTASTAFEDNGRSGRIALGYRFVPLSFGSFSVEGGYMGFNVERLYNDVRSPFDGHEYFAAAKFNYPFSPMFEAFGRLGYEHSSFTSQSNLANSELDGNGALLGAGIEFRLRGNHQHPTSAFPLLVVGRFHLHREQHGRLREPVAWRRRGHVHAWRDLRFLSTHARWGYVSRYLTVAGDLTSGF